QLCLPRITIDSLDGIRHLLASPENYDYDVKRELNISTDGTKKEFCKDVSAFANTNGGALIIGVEDDHIFVGIPTALPSDQIQQVLESRLSPPLGVSVVNFPWT